MNEPDEVLMTYAEVSKLFSVGEHTIMRWVKAGQFPPPKYFGSTARFVEQQVLQIRRQGLLPKGSFQPPVSPNALIGRQGSMARARKSLSGKRKPRKRVRK